MYTTCPLFAIAPVSKPALLVAVSRAPKYRRVPEAAAGFNGSIIAAEPLATSESDTNQLKSILKVSLRNATKLPSKPLISASTFQLIADVSLIAPTCMPFLLST